jgi:hypothetical protein
VSIPAHLLVHTASVEVYDSSTGDFAAAVDLPCYFEQKVTNRFRDTDGSESVADATLYADLGDTIPVGSRLSVNGVGGTVVALSVFDDGGITGLEHRELLLRLWPL